MAIYSILSSKPHNPHYLNRYITFIEQCQQKNVDYHGYVENHHICPKADDMFPEYIDFTLHPWNKAPLTPRQHIIAHQILSKTFPNIYSVIYSYWAMSNMNDQKISSRLYESTKIKIRKLQSKKVKERIENGTHHWCDENGNLVINRLRVEAGTHHWLGPENNRKRVEAGTHNWLGPESNRKRVEAGTHNFLGKGEEIRERQLRRAKEGIHAWQPPEFKEFNAKRTTERNNRMVDNGTHQFLNSVCCVDIEGNIHLVSKEEYKNNDDLVHISSVEGKELLGKERVKLGPRSEEYKEKLSKSAKKRLSDPTKNPNYGKRRKLMSKGDETRLVELHLIDEHLSEGWSLGNNETTKKKFVHAKNPNQGKKRKLMTKEKESKLVELSLVDDYLSNGWVLGNNGISNKYKTGKGIPIVFRDKRYDSIIDCSRITGVSVYMIKKELKLTK